MGFLRGSKRHQRFKAYLCTCPLPVIFLLSKSNFEKMCQLYILTIFKYVIVGNLPKYAKSSMDHWFRLQILPIWFASQIYIYICTLIHPQFTYCKLQSGSCYYLLKVTDIWEERRAEGREKRKEEQKNQMKIKMFTWRKHEKPRKVWTPNITKTSIKVHNSI